MTAASHLPSLTRAAFAKVNLTLAVGPPIPAPSPVAGYHPIASWMAGVDLSDDVTVTRLPEGTPSRATIEWARAVARPSAIDWPIEKDLAVRAHRLLETEVGRPLPVELRVIKRIPVGGGLGGGSADAAATLLAVRDLFALQITPQRLLEISMRLGSDVAFFLAGDPHDKAAIVSNLGEHIERVPSVSCPITLFFPPFGCPTGPVYKAFDASTSAAAGFEDRAARVRHLVDLAARERFIRTDELFNDLASPACHVEPRLRDVIDRLAAHLNARVHVTGSGSTLFALPESDEQARRLATLASEATPGVVGVATRIV